MSPALSSSFATLNNGRSIALEAIPSLPIEAFGNALLDAVADGARISALFGAADPASGSVRLYALLADDARNRLRVTAAALDGDAFPSLTPRCPQVHLFEREIAEQFGLRPIGHPWLKPLRFRRSWTGRDAWNRPVDQPIPPAAGDFYRIEGDEAHEVAVGPVHAGIIEPGHFRFQCRGERVLHLEIALGYQHRGAEEAFPSAGAARAMALAETVSGDATAAHATAFCQVCEALADCRIPPRAQSLRGVALELERLANHVGDLGALANDIGFLPTASYCGRIRGDYLNMTALLSGSRFGRGLFRPGGVAFDLEPARAHELLNRLAAAGPDTAGAVSLLWETQSVLNRFEGVGAVSRDVAGELGLVGPAARASGLNRDIRQDQPSGLYQFAHLPVATAETGDVFARAFVRGLEIQQSLAFIREQIRALPAGEIRTPPAPLRAGRFAAALVEGWRGETCHAAITDEQGRFRRYKIVDPSFHNWPGLAMALRNQEISDFPICNKSFNLSYCGHDL